MYMNQIISKAQKQIYHIEFGDEIAEIPYNETDNNTQSKKHFFIKNKYRLQFFISLIIASIFLVIFVCHIYQTNQKEKISKILLNNYSLTTLYQSKNESQSQRQSAIIENPFVIGMIKIEKLGLNYPILSESNSDLLKISLCRFAGPMPNEIGNLCIAGHNYVDNKFFSNLDKLERNDVIEIYDLTGQKITYSVTNKYEADSNDLTCTNQDVGENKILTLLTCNNTNGKRIIVTAKSL